MNLSDQLARLQTVRELHNDSAGIREHGCRSRLDAALAALEQLRLDQAEFDRQSLAKTESLNERVLACEMPAQAVDWLHAERTLGRSRLSERMARASHRIVEARQAYEAARTARHQTEVQLEKVRFLASEINTGRRRRDDRLGAMTEDEESAQQTAANSQFAALRERVSHD